MVRDETKLNFGEDKKMKKNILRGWIPTTGLVLIMAFNTFANGGIVVQGATGSDVKGQCVEKVDSGIVVQGFGGMLVSDFVGMLVSDFAKIIVSDLKGTNSCAGEKVDNGIVVQGLAGMLVSD